MRSLKYKTMRRKHLLAASAAALIAVLSADFARAELVASREPPSFTREELIIINRNASLLEMSKTNPWIVRRLLDSLEKTEPGSAANQPPPSGENSSDPDLGSMERASPEAVHDLFQLLKQAGKKDDKAK